MTSLSMELEYQWLFIMLLATVTTASPPSLPEAAEMVEGIVKCHTYTHIDGVSTCGLLESSSLVDLLTTLPSDVKEIHVLGSRKPLITGNVESIPARPDVQVLVLSRCHMTKLDPRLFQIFPNLLELHIDENHIKELMASHLADASHLQLLNISDNSLYMLEEDTLKHVVELKVLDLSHNDLDALQTHFLRALPFLEQLYLHNNHLEVLSPLFLKQLSHLRVLDLHNNMLDGLQSDMLDDLFNLTDIHLAGNPWNCHCGLHQMIEVLSGQSTPMNSTGEKGILKDMESMKCGSPENLAGHFVTDLLPEAFECEEPLLGASPHDGNISIVFMNSAVLHCNATGVPQPSIYWITPRGVVSHPTFAKWLPGNISITTENLTYAGQPTFYETSIHALENGSLLIKQLRLHFSGQYECIAVNPAGEESWFVDVAVVSHIQGYLLVSLVYGGATMVGFLLISLMVGGIQMLVERLILKRKPLKLPDGTVFTVSEHALEELDDLGSIYSSMYSLHWYSPEDSPVKCVTPAEDDLAEEQFTEMANGIRYTLEDARTRLRCGVERQVFRIRNRAAHVRDSGSRYMHTLRETGSRKLYNIRETGSKQLRNIRNSSSVYANRVRAGMVLGAEQVKYHVQSMKELCGTGEMSHTISTVSVSTDVDSRRQTEVVRTITYV